MAPAAQQKIAVIPGDGIGPEVARGGVSLLERLARLRGLPLAFEWFDFGAERYLKDGTILPEGFMDRLRREYAAVYFGAVGDPRVPGNEHAKGILLAMRFELDLYINLRPCILMDDRLSPLKGKGRSELRFTVFPANTEGRYTGTGAVFKKAQPDEVARNGGRGGDPPGAGFAFRAGARQRAGHRRAGQGEPAGDGADRRADARAPGLRQGGAAREPGRRGTDPRRRPHAGPGSAARWPGGDHRAGRRGAPRAPGEADVIESSRSEPLVEHARRGGGAAPREDRVLGGPPGLHAARAQDRLPPPA